MMMYTLGLISGLVIGVLSSLLCGAFLILKKQKKPE